MLGIDRDNRKPKEVDKLAESNIFALEVYSVEALYYYSEVIAAVAHRHAESWGVDDPNEIIGSFQQEAIEVLRDSKLGDTWVSFFLRKVATLRDIDWGIIEPYFIIPEDRKQIDVTEIELNQDIDEIGGMRHISRRIG